MLQGINISKTINQRSILSAIDIEIKSSAITALIGPSGGGKSTLIRTLSLLEPPDEGIIIFDDRSFTFPVNEKRKPNLIHPHISVVFQQFHLWPHLTVKQNLLMPLSLQGRAIDNNEFEKLISYFELETLMNRYPYQISVGQKQRAAFVRAVLLKPKYLLLDEITSALDIRHIGKVLSYIQDLAKNGTGILIATHLLGFASKAASEIIFLDSGKIIEKGGTQILKFPQTKLLTDFLNYIEHVG